MEANANFLEIIPSVAEKKVDIHSQEDNKNYPSLLEIQEWLTVYLADLLEIDPAEYDIRLNSA